MDLLQLQRKVHISRTTVVVESHWNDQHSMIVQLDFGIKNKSLENINNRLERVLSRELLSIVQVLVGEAYLEVFLSTEEEQLKTNLLLVDGKDSLEGLSIERRLEFFFHPIYLIVYNSISPRSNINSVVLKTSSKLKHMQ